MVLSASIRKGQIYYSYLLCQVNWGFLGTSTVLLSLLLEEVVCQML